MITVEQLNGRHCLAEPLVWLSTDVKVRKVHLTTTYARGLTVSCWLEWALVWLAVRTEHQIATRGRISRTPWSTLFLAIPQLRWPSCTTYHPQHPADQHATHHSAETALGPYPDLYPCKGWALMILHTQTSWTVEIMSEWFSALRHLHAVQIRHTCLPLSCWKVATAQHATAVPRALYALVTVLRPHLA